MVTGRASVGWRRCPAVRVSSSTLSRRPRMPPRRRRAPRGGAESEDRPGVHSIGGLYEQVEGALSQAFPRNRHLWVRGEIQHVSDHRSGHLYLSLVDPDDDATRRDRGRGGVPTLNVKCWRTSWAPLRHGLAKQGIELTEGMVVVLRGALDLYRAKGEISLILAEVDVTALLGRLAAQRSLLLHTLESEGLLRRNVALAMPDVPLHVGLVASRDTEGCRDFLGQLQGSGFAFRVSHVPVTVQGPAAAASIARALTALSRSDCDVIALVRGGERGRPGGLRARGGGPGRGLGDQAGLHGYRAYGRRDGGRHRGGAGVHHTDRVRSADRGGDGAVVGRQRRRARRTPGPSCPGIPRRRPAPRHPGTGPLDGGGPPTAPCPS